VPRTMIRAATGLVQLRKVSSMIFSVQGARSYVLAVNLVRAKCSVASTYSQRDHLPFRITFLIASEKPPTLTCVNMPVLRLVTNHRARL
jgi:hypothetical protein